MDDDYFLSLAKETNLQYTSIMTPAEKEWKDAEIKEYSFYWMTSSNESKDLIGYWTKSMTKSTDVFISCMVYFIQRLRYGIDNKVIMKEPPADFTKKKAMPIDTKLAAFMAEIEGKKDAKSISELDELSDGKSLLFGTKSSKTLSGEKTDEKFEEKLKSLDEETAVSICGFYSSLLCRLMIKEPENVKTHMELKSSQRITDFLSPKCADVRFPEMNLAWYERISIILKTNDDYRMSIIIPYLYTFTTVKEADKKIKGYLNYTLLLSLSYNGMTPFSLSQQIVTKGLYPSFDNLFKDMYNMETKDSIDEMKKIENTMANKEDFVLWPWARVVSDRYFRKLSSSQNLYLLIQLAALLEPDGKSGPWKIPVLKDMKGVAHIIFKEKFLELTQKIQAKQRMQ